MIKNHAALPAVPLTGLQIRAARRGLAWTVRDLAQRSGVGTTTIVRYEMCDGVPPSRKNNLAVLRAALEAAGIEFIGTPDDGPGLPRRATSRPGTWAAEGGRATGAREALVFGPPVTA